MVEKGDFFYVFCFDCEGEGVFDLIFFVCDSLMDFFDGDKEFDIIKSDIEDLGGIIIVCVRVEVVFCFDVLNVFIEGESIFVFDMYFGKVIFFCVFEVLEEYFVGFDCELVRFVINLLGFWIMVC